MQGPRSESGNHQLWMVKPTSKSDKNVPRSVTEEPMSSARAGFVPHMSPRVVSARLFCKETWMWTQGITVFCTGDSGITDEDISADEKRILKDILWFHGMLLYVLSELGFTAMYCVCSPVHFYVWFVLSGKSRLRVARLCIASV